MEVKLSRSFYWKIQGLSNLASLSAEFERVVFKVGNKNHELASTWIFSISPTSGRMTNIKVMPFELPESFTTDLSASIRFTLSWKNYSNNTNWAHISSNTKNEYKVLDLKGEGATMVPFSLPVQRGLWADANGVIDIRVVVSLTGQICKSKSTTENYSPFECFQIIGKAKAAKDFIEYSDRMDPRHAIKIISNDGVELIAAKYKLAARSPVFEAMLRPNTEEGQTGTVRLPDIGSAGLKVFLHFISKGELLPEWNRKDVVVDLTCAAHKHQIPELLEFLDKNLGGCCVMEISGELICLARKFSLKTAESDILKYIKENIGNSFEDLEKFVKGFMIEQENAEGDDGLVKSRALK